MSIRVWWAVRSGAGAVMLVLCLLASRVVHAQLEVPKVQGASVQSMAVLGQQSDIVEYRYRVVSASTALLPLYRIKIDIISPSERSLVSGDGLGNDEGFIYADVGLLPIVPVYSPSAPEGWLRAITARGELRWSTVTDPISPGGQRSPFVAVSRGLPGIRSVAIESVLLDFLPPLDSGVSLEEIAAAVQGSAQTLSAVGPVAPPDPFDPLGFLGEIVELRISAVSLGWIRSAPEVDVVDGMLAQIESQLQEGRQLDAAQTALTAASAVEAASCATFDCELSSPMTAEARALLAVNLLYLRSALLGDGNGDADGDGVPDSQDVCPAGDDTRDEDDDGLRDACDSCPIDPENDFDGDGFCAGEDNCPNVMNENQSDISADGVGDACEADNDGDGIPDDSDNCPLTINPDQDDRHCPNRSGWTG